LHQDFAIASQNLAFRGPRGPGPSKAHPPRGLVGHWTSVRPLNPPLHWRHASVFRGLSWSYRLQKLWGLSWSYRSYETL